MDFYAALAAELDLADALEGFDIDLVGFDCADALHDEWIEDIRNFKWHCPFQPAPGCGAASRKECPALKRLALMSAAPKRRQ